MIFDKVEESALEVVEEAEVDPRHAPMIRLLSSGRKTEKKQALKALQIHARVPEFSRLFPLSFPTRYV
tara:strand:- start:421 stop:624 length:204 start_codon:yes stop_codon:yes gene_type:complete